MNKEYGSVSWKEFKDRIESLGVKDDTEISYIDASMFDGLEHLYVDRRGTIENLVSIVDFDPN